MRVDVFADDRTGIRIVERRHIDRRSILPLCFALVEMECPSLNVVDATEFVGIADRPVHRSSGNAKRALDVVEQCQRIARRAIELVDECQNRQAMTPAHFEELARLRLDAVRRVDHHHHAVSGNQRAVGILTEILVTWRIEERDASSLQLELQRC